MANPNANQNGNGNVVATRAEGNGNGNNENQIRCYNCRGLGNLAWNCTVRPRRRDAAYLQTQLLIAQKELTKLPSMIQMDQLSVEQSGGTLEQHPATVKETCAYFESLYNNLAIEVDKVNTVNRKMKETNADLTTELARYKIQKIHLSSAKMITTLNEEIANLNNQLLKEKSTVSPLQEEKKS
ncbi:hypothetical protein Tco_1283010 [Tanacetum coccineum]